MIEYRVAVFGEGGRLEWIVCTTTHEKTAIKRFRETNPPHPWTAKLEGRETGPWKDIPPGPGDAREAGQP